MDIYIAHNGAQNTFYFTRKNEDGTFSYLDIINGLIVPKKTLPGYCPTFKSAKKVAEEYDLNIIGEYELGW